MQQQTTPVDSAMHDVVIMGGGLAGLTLAMQLRRRLPGLDVLVIERRRHPVPVATHKVGESTVELAAHYFAEVLGLREHLETAQIRKFGFRFFFSDGRRDIENVTELGASRALPMVSWQIDRGIFENFLAEEAQRRGIRFTDASRVTRMRLADDDGAHEVEWLQGDAPRRARCRWLIDACGRAGLIKRQLDLAEDSPHECHAVWFRIGERIAIDDWSDDPAWQARCTPAERWRSTNHLVGTGYWVWLIPLASGSHSVGIVADPRHHPLSAMDSFDKAMDWLAVHQPRLHDDLEGKRDRLQDFAFFRKFSHGCKQVFSGRRWALTGEAGLFLDPFYSPGSDFIAISNTFITELVVREHAGHRVDGHAWIYDQVFHSFYDSTMALYQDQYGLFGDPEVLPVKVVWDYTYYWGVLSQLFVMDRVTDLKSLSVLRDELARCQRLNVEVQKLLRAWGEVSERRNPPAMLDQAELPWFAELNASLGDRLDDTAFRDRLRQSARLLAELADEILDRARATHPRLDARGVRGALGGALEPPRRTDRLFATAPA